MRAAKGTGKNDALCPYIMIEDKTGIIKDFFPLIG
jgi:hypothetical protein